MNSTQHFISENKERFLNELIDLLKIPSISADPTYSKDVHTTAQKLAEDLRRIGIDNVEEVDISTIFPLSASTSV